MANKDYQTAFKRCFFICCLLSFPVYGQTINHQVLKDNLSSIRRVSEQLPVEKLYLQTDKPYYTSSDTLWFKAYLLNRDFLTPSALSGLLYVELDNNNGNMVKRIMVPVTFGMAWAQIALNEREIPPGSYILRAYSNWQRNFGENYVFKKTIYISSAGDATLVKTSYKLDSLLNKNKVTATFYFSSLNKEALRFKDMKLQVTDGKHSLYRQKATTYADGSLNYDFELPAKTDLKKLVIKAQQTGNGADSGTLTIPVDINRPANTDLQFMPEGGNLVAGIPAKIAFKAIGEDGKSIMAHGSIFNSKHQAITNFKVAHAGMGNFEIIPQHGETYNAEAVLADGTRKIYPLPVVNPTGTSLAVVSLSQDSLLLTITENGQGAQNGAYYDTYYVIGQTRGVVCYAQAIDLKNACAIKINKGIFPTGIARFTLLNAANLPLNERQVFINHQDNLQIIISSNKLNYATRDSVALALTVKDKEGKPVQGNFSLAVTDDSQVHTDSLGSNINNNLLLTSDLKGNIEEPDYYFEGDKSIELDNLLLAQGWVGYNWKEVFTLKNTPPAYQPEKEFMVKGTITNGFNKPVAGAKLLLVGSNPPMLMDTVTGKDGRFYFKGLVPLDTALFKLQVRTRKGSSFNVNISGEEFDPPKFDPLPLVTPWYINSDTSLLENAVTRQQQNAKADLIGNRTQLKEVTIKDKKIIPGSKNLNGPGEYDEAYDEKDFKNANKMTLGAFLEKNIRGYVVSGIWHLNPWDYVLKGKKIHFIIDGMDLENGYDFSKTPSRLERFLFIRNNLDYFKAEDITGIEVMYNTSHIASYGIQYAPIGKLSNDDGHAYIEITTRAKKGPFMRITPGTYLYKTLGFTLSKQFYSPNYTFVNKNMARGIDLRSTIYWSPNIMTDVLGKATLSFYSADKAATYTITIEGTDLNGQIGHYTKKIKVTVTSVK